MLAHSLLISWLLRLCKPLLKRRRELLRYHRSQLAAGVVAWSGTHDVLVLSRKPGPSAWVGCARHSSSASRCCEERRATGHVSARKSTTAAAAEAEPKKTPPRKRVGSGGTTRLSPEGASSQHLRAPSARLPFQELGALRAHVAGKHCCGELPACARFLPLRQSLRTRCAAVAERQRR